MPGHDPPPMLFKDPFLPWLGGFPYEWLDARLREVGHPGVVPSSSAQTIKEAFYDLMVEAVPADRSAWDLLRRFESRLLVDFFLYRIDPPPGGPAGGARDAVGSTPGPVEGLTPVAPPVQDLAAVPPVPIEPESTPVPPLDLGDLTGGAFEWLGV